MFANNIQKDISVLIPTYKRTAALAVTLTSLYYQSETSFDIIISDQSPESVILHDASIQTIIRLLKTKEINVTILKNFPSRGMAQQRQFLLEQSHTPISLFLDDDLILDSYVLSNMKQMLKKQDCGFVGCAVIGLSYLEDDRPHQQHIEFWEEKVVPEVINPKHSNWKRYVLHNAANIYHIQQKCNINFQSPKAYKISWVGGCTMYNTEKLRSVGGFDFWKELPENHCGEDVLAQLRVMREYGGCGVLPSGVYHQELQTTVPDRTINAPEALEI